MSILFAILLFSILIFVHELGHFLAAKASGVQVNEFAMFMGPAIAKWGKGETTYSIRCIPIGGYCAMEGEDEDTDNPRSFQKAAWWKRLIILVAGAAMNLLAGVLLLAIAFSAQKTDVLPIIASATPGNTVVYEEGLHIGDRILEIDGERVYQGSDFSLLLALTPGDVHDVVVERDGHQVVLDDFRMEKHMLPNGSGEEQLLYGINLTAVTLDFAGHVRLVAMETVNTVRMVRLSLQMLLTGQAGLQDMTGPVGIVQMMSETAEASHSALAALLNMLYFGGFIAINLAVMNLLPIPALDGGRVVGLLLTTAIEAILGRKIDSKYEGYIHSIGMFLLLALMALIMFKDIFTIFKG